MSAIFDAAADQLNLTGWAPTADTTIVMYLKVGWDPTNNAITCWALNWSPDGSNVVRVTYFARQMIFGVIGSGVTCDPTTPVNGSGLVQSGWVACAFRFSDSGNIGSIWTGPVGGTMTKVAEASEPCGLPAGTATLQVGNWNGGGSIGTSASSKMWGLTIWDVALSDGDIGSLSTTPPNLVDPTNITQQNLLDSDLSAETGSALTTGGVTFDGADNPEFLPAAPVPTYPADAATDVELEVLLEWDAAALADEYQVYLNAEDNPPITPLGDPTVSTSMLSGPLEPNTTYYWRVGAINEAGETLSNVWSFTTGSSSASRNPRTNRSGRNSRRHRH